MCLLASRRGVKQYDLGARPVLGRCAPCALPMPPDQRPRGSTARSSSALALGLRHGDGGEVPARESGTSARVAGVAAAVLWAGRRAHPDTLELAAAGIPRDSSADRRRSRAVGIAGAGVGGGAGDDADERNAWCAVLDANARSARPAARSEGAARGERRARGRGRGRGRTGGSGRAGRGLTIDVALTVAARRAATLVGAAGAVPLRGASVHEWDAGCVPASATADRERQPVALAAVLAVREALTDDPDDAARLTRTPIDRGA